MAHTREALATLEYGIGAHKGFIVLTGEVGTGKTTLLRAALASFEPGRVFSSFVFNPRLEVLDFFEFILADFGIVPQTRTKSGMLIQLNRWLVERFRHDETCVIVIDEAQNLTWEQLEEVRLLTNLETPTRKLVQIVLSGQPELEEKLTRARPAPTAPAHRPLGAHPRHLRRRDLRVHHPAPARRRLLRSHLPSRRRRRHPSRKLRNPAHHQPHLRAGPHPGLRRTAPPGPRSPHPRRGARPRPRPPILHGLLLALRNSHRPRACFAEAHAVGGRRRREMSNIYEAMRRAALESANRPAAEPAPAI